MNFRNIILSNWLVDRGDSRLGNQLPPVDDDWRQKLDCESEKTSHTVQRAMECLTDDETEIVIRYYLMGESLSEIGARSGRRQSSLNSLLRRAVTKMRRKLSPFAAEKFGLNIAVETRCCLCNSPRRSEIDLLMKERDVTKTWKSIISVLRSDFDIEISTPQILIGHEKYHM